MVRDAESEAIEEPNENSRKLKGLFLEVDSVMRHSGMTTSVTVRARHGCWRRWCMSEDHIRLALLLSCSCGDCVATYSAPAAFSRGAQGLQLTTSSQSLMLWSAGIAACEDPEVLFFKAVSRAECAEWILFFFAVMLSGEDSAVLLWSELWVAARWA